MEIWIERYRQRAEQRYRRLDALLATMSSIDKDGADDVSNPRDEPRDDHRG